jgi:hypothetical protein
VKEQDIRHVKYFRLIRKLLGRLHAHKDCPNRKLHYDEFMALVLLHFFNPVLSGLRSIQEASGLRKVQRKLGVGRTSLGSLSEASGDFDPALLGSVVQELAGQVQAQDGPARPAGLSKELAVVAVDGTLLEALPRMAWAVWLSKEHRAAKLNLEFNVLRSVPQAARLTQGNANEKQALRDWLAEGKLYLVDAGYAEYRLFEEIRQAKSFFIGRLRDNAVWEVLEDRPLTEADRKAGVVCDQVVRLGCPSKQADLSEPLRVVKVHVQSPPERGLARRAMRMSSKKTFRHRPEEYDLILGTNLMDLPAESIALLFRYRWTIELFFRWLKCVLRLRHLIFERPNGLQLLVYAALVATLLIVLWTGRKPTKRMLEMIQLYFQGWADLEELEARIARFQKTGR